MITSKYAVTGMTCEHCVKAVTSELSGIEGVSGVDVDLKTGDVTVTSATQLDEATVAQAIDEAGYEMAGANKS